LKDPIEWKWSALLSLFPGFLLKLDEPAPQQKPRKPTAARREAPKQNAPAALWQRGRI
jgi:hypothetical protein